MNPLLRMANNLGSFCRQFVRRIIAAVTTSPMITQVSHAAEPSGIFNVQRLSDRALLLTEKSSMENIVVALKSQKGLVIVDTFGSPVTARAARKVIEDAFGCNDFAYVVNTHPHWDHAWGNQAFPEAKIIGFQGAAIDIEQSKNSARQMADRSRRQLASIEKRLQSAPEAKRPALEREIACMQRIAEGLRTDFQRIPPSITFTDRKTVELGDLTLNLVFFGRAHSGEDIFVHVPEENLLITGDVFLDRGWMPLFAGQERLDIPRWIEVLDDFLAQDIKTVVPGHREPWTPATLKLWRDYIAYLWNGVKVAKEAGLDLEGTKKRLPPPSGILYLKELGHCMVNIEAFHQRNIEAFWREVNYDPL